MHWSFGYYYKGATNEPRRKNKQTTKEVLAEYEGNINKVWDYSNFVRGKKTSGILSFLQILYV